MSRSSERRDSDSSLPRGSLTHLRASRKRASQSIKAFNTFLPREYKVKINPDERPENRREFAAWDMIYGFYAILSDIKTPIMISDIVRDLKTLCVSKKFTDDIQRIGDIHNLVVEKHGLGEKITRLDIHNIGKRKPMGSYMMKKEEKKVEKLPMEEPPMEEPPMEEPPRMTKKELILEEKRDEMPSGNEQGPNINDIRTATEMENKSEGNGLYGGCEQCKKCPLCGKGRRPVQKKRQIRPACRLEDIIHAPDPDSYRLPTVRGGARAPRSSYSSRDLVDYSSPIPVGGARIQRGKSYSVGIKQPVSSAVEDVSVPLYQKNIPGRVTSRLAYIP